MLDSNALASERSLFLLDTGNLRQNIQLSQIGEQIQILESGQFFGLIGQRTQIASCSKAGMSSRESGKQSREVFRGKRGANIHILRDNLRTVNHACHPAYKDVLHAMLIKTLQEIEG